MQKNLAAESELHTKTAALHNLQLQLTGAQTNNQNMLQMLESYESKAAFQTKKVKKAEEELAMVMQRQQEDSKEKDLLEWKLT